MNSVGRWFDEQAGRERRAVLLEDALLGGRFGAYIRYRLRFWLARYGLASIVQVVQILVLHRLFPHESFIALIGLLAAGGLAVAAWWGALELLRTRVRDLYRSGAPHRVPAEIGRWLSGALRIGLAGCAIAVVFVVARALTSPGGLGAVDLAAGAIVVRVAIDIPRRCYHSGIYALRRVYRPLPSILALEVVSVGSLIVLAPFLGAWAAPAAELVAISLVTAISVAFTARAYRLAGLAPQRHVRILPRRRSSGRARRRSDAGERPVAWRTVRAALPPAAAAAGMSLDSFVVPAMFGAAGEAGAGWSTALLVAAVAPSLRAGFDWSQLLYFDLKRLDSRPFANLRQRFVGDAVRVAPLLALVFWVVSGAIATVALGAADLGGVVLRLELSLLPFFIASSYLSLGLIDAFTTGRYGRTVLGGAVLGAGLLALGPLTTIGVAPVAGLDGAVLAALLAFVLTGPIDRAWGGSTRDILLPVEWLDRVGREPGALVVATVRFGPPPGARTAEEERTAAWHRRAVARHIAHRLGRAGGVTAVSVDGLAWFECLEANRPRRTNRGWLLQALSGSFRGFREAEAPTGRSAIATIIDWGTFGRLEIGPDGREAVAERIEATPAAAAAGLVGAFRETFPDGVVFEPDRPAPAGFRERTARERRTILAEATRFAQGLPPRGRGSRFEVTAYCPAGRLRVIFLAERSTSTRADRSRWRTLLRQVHLAAAARADGGDSGSATRILSSPARGPGTGGAAVDTPEGVAAASRQRE